MSSRPQSEQKNLQQFNRFLKNNNDLLQQKYHEHFAQQKIKITSREPKIETVVSFISDVFSFDQTDKNANNKEIIKESLRNSYDAFLKANHSIKEFNVSVAIELLRFCIESNQMFAVQYENNREMHENAGNNAHQAKPVKTNPQENVQQSGAQGKLNQNSQENEESERRKLQNLGINSNNQNEFSGMGNSIQGETPLSKPKHRNTFDDGELQNQFNFHEEIKLDLDPVLIKKNIKIVFQYYCKQQMALSPNLSFDRIQRESHMMTISKILLMARMMNVINGAITKELLISKFRKISEGKREIDFKKFDILMSQLQIQDPSLIARAELNSPQIHLYLKTTKKPFDTQDMLPRELIKNRNFQNKLTLHSGKMESDLIEDLRTKRNSCMLEDNDRSKDNKDNEKSSLKSSGINLKMKQYYEQVAQKMKQKDRYEKQKQTSKVKEAQNVSLLRKQSEIITTKNLAKQRNYSHDLSMLKIRKIIPVDVEDDKWLGQYKINSSIKRAQAHDDSLQKKRSFEGNQRNSILIRDLKRRVKQIQQTQNSSNGLDETKPYLISPLRRG